MLQLALEDDPWGRATIASRTLAGSAVVAVAILAIGSVAPALRCNALGALLVLVLVGLATWLLRRGHLSWSIALVLCGVELLLTDLVFTASAIRASTPALMGFGAVLGALLGGPAVGGALTLYGMLIVTAVSLLGVRSESSEVALFSTQLTTNSLLGLAILATIWHLLDASRAAKERVMQLARARDYADAIVQCMAEPMPVANGSGIVIQANDAALQLLSRERHEVRGVKIHTLVSIRADVRWTLGSAIRTEGLAHPKSGTPIPVEVSWSQMLDPDGEFRSVLVASDIRLRVAAVARMEEAARAAHAAGQAKSAFLAGTSHELRTPLNAIIGYAEILAEDLCGEDASDAQKIHRAAKRLLSLINDILDLSKLEAGRMTLQLETMSIRALAAEIVSELGPLADERGNTLDVRLEGSDSPWLSDPYKLRHVLHNLLSNAIKFTDGGHIKLSIRQTDHALHISVDDTGMGIAADRLEHLFQPHLRQATSQGVNCGLGLAVSAEFVRLMSGTIDADTMFTKGSTFTVDLPRLAS